VVVALLLALVAILILAFFTQQVMRGAIIACMLYSPYTPWNVFIHARRWKRSCFSAELRGQYGSGFDVLVVSDLHIATSGRDGVVRTLEDQIGNDAVLSFLHQAIGRVRPRIDIVSGDIIDIGNDEAWAIAREQLSRYKQLELVVVPGNHDVNFQRWNEPHTEDAMYSETAIVEQISKLTGDDSNEMTKFPHIFRSRDLPIDVLTLNSNRYRTSWPRTNAVGMVGVDQLREARQLLNQRSTDRLLLIVPQHHIIPPIGLQTPLLRCIDAHKALQLAREHRARAIIPGHTQCHTFITMIPLYWYPADR
jgi:3',5'-cyclic AMP phosphodiesterase CpdA